MPIMTAPMPPQRIWYEGVAVLGEDMLERDAVFLRHWHEHRLTKRCGYVPVPALWLVYDGRSKAHAQLGPILARATALGLDVTASFRKTTNAPAGRTLVHWAALADAQRALPILCQYPFDLEAADGAGHTPAELAAFEDHDEFLARLRAWQARAASEAVLRTALPAP